jgi:hypothetical protein
VLPARSFTRRRNERILDNAQRSVDGGAGRASPESPLPDRVGRC